MGCPALLTGALGQRPTSVVFGCPSGAAAGCVGDVAVTEAGLGRTGLVTLGWPLAVLMHLQVAAECSAFPPQFIVGVVVLQRAVFLQVGLELLPAPLVAAVEGHAQHPQEADRHGDGGDGQHLSLVNLFALHELDAQVIWVREDGVSLGQELVTADSLVAFSTLAVLVRPAECLDDKALAPIQAVGQVLLMARLEMLRVQRRDGRRRCFAVAVATRCQSGGRCLGCSMFRGPHCC